MAIRDRYNGKGDNFKTLVEIYKEHNAQCRKLIGIDFTESTVDKFDTSLSHLKEFMEHDYRRNDIPLFEIDNKFVKDFEIYLKTVRGCQHNSSLKHLKNLKKVIRIAQANGWVKKDPFYGVKFSYEDTGIEFLTREELETIINKEFTIPRLAQVRDIFVFCCFTALAFIDVKQLSKEHIIKDNEGNLWINKDRQKTGVMCNVPVLPIAAQILKKYEFHPECLKNEVLLPVLSNQKMNSYLKEIADLCGITKKLSTHVARHTAATVVFLANEVKIENVARILGHRKLQMTQHYAKVLDSSIMRDMSSVKNSFASMMGTNAITAEQQQ
jgi:Site-specific recombinase XerD